MRRSIWLLGAVMMVLSAVGCGPPDAEEMLELEQAEAAIATPILFGASCPMPSTCGPDYERCTEWSAPTSCGDPSAGIAFQVQTCHGAQGGRCRNVALSATR